MAYSDAPAPPPDLARAATADAAASERAALLGGALGTVLLLLLGAAAVAVRLWRERQKRSHARAALTGAHGVVAAVNHLATAEVAAPAPSSSDDVRSPPPAQGFRDNPLARRRPAVVTPAALERTALYAPRQEPHQVPVAPIFRGGVDVRYNPQLR